MNLIYHITTAAAWHLACQQGYYECESLHTEGFIHCSTLEQIPGVVQRYYNEHTQLQVMCIDESAVAANLKWELSPSLQEFFPHVYASINVNAVHEVIAYEIFIQKNY